MTIEFESSTYKIPSWALPALVNSDYTALMDDDEAYVDNLFEWFDSEYGQGNWHIGEVGEQYFGRADFDNLSGDICDVELVYKMVELEA
jgi:hypothetical protein